MELNLDMRDLERMVSGKSQKEIRGLIKKSMTALAMEWESEAKRIVQSEILDTGTFLNSIHTEVYEEGDDVIFIGMDGIKYGIYHEYGTIKHFVPFYKNGNINEPILADWAKRVLGMDEESMLKQGGMMIEIKESKPFMRAMIKSQAEAPDIFKETFTEV
jgi:hypothetical protein